MATGHHGINMADVEEVVGLEFVVLVFTCPRESAVVTPYWMETNIPVAIVAFWLMLMMGLVLVEAVMDLDTLGVVRAKRRNILS